MFFFASATYILHKWIKIEIDLEFSMFSQKKILHCIIFSRAWSIGCVRRRLAWRRQMVLDDWFTRLLHQPQVMLRHLSRFLHSYTRCQCTAEPVLLSHSLARPLAFYGHISKYFIYKYFYCFNVCQYYFSAWPSISPISQLTPFFTKFKVALQSRFHCTFNTYRCIIHSFTLLKTKAQNPWAVFE